MTAETIAKALGGRKAGGGWMARCPAHDDREPSLSIRDADDGKVLVRCHAGCEQERVISILRSRGLWQRTGSTGRFAPSIANSTKLQAGSGRRQAQRGALAIWRSTTPAEHWSKPISPLAACISRCQTLRFHAGLKHPSGGIWPAMVALVTRGADGRRSAIHRTFLARDGAGKAPVDPPKMMLGPCRGGAVRLAACRRRADGRRGHRDLPRRHAGDRPSGLGGTFDLGAARSRSAGRRA